MEKYVCQICGFVYDEEKGIPSAGIAPGTKWDQLPENWVCPICGAAKSQFKKVEQKPAAAIQSRPLSNTNKESSAENLRELSSGELAALCSNLARGCEKQYLSEESALYTALADYYTKKTKLPEAEGFDELIRKINKDLADSFPAAKEAAEEKPDRGAKRVLTWSEKVTRISASVLEKYQKEGISVLEHTKMWVCDICGFLYIGDVPPAVCPICKVPSFKILEVARV